jgi:hypothetical protein
MKSRQPAMCKVLSPTKSFLWQMRRWLLDYYPLLMVRVLYFGGLNVCRKGKRIPETIW